MNRTGIAIFDMDDTIVDKEQVFVDAQTTMLRVLAMHDARINPENDIHSLRQIDHELVRLHKGKHNYDYRELAEALWLYFHEGKDKLQVAKLAFSLSRKDAMPAFVIEAAERHDFILANRVPILFKNAKALLRKLKENYFLVLFPSGKRSSQMNVARSTGLDKIFDLILIRERKNANTYSQVKRLSVKMFMKSSMVSPKRIVVIGDRISQDIIPAKKIGLETIWLPGPYYPGSRKEGEPDHEIRHLSELLKILIPQD